MTQGGSSLKGELLATLRLAGPIVLAQAGHMTMGLADTLVAGRISTTALAGLGLGANFFWTFTAVCMGCLMAFDTLFSQAMGARDEKSVERHLGQSLWTSLGVTFFCAACIALAGVVYLGLAPPGPIRNGVVDYVKIVALSLPSLFLFFVLQRYWQARHQVAPFVVIIIAANLLNLAANFALGLGWWGFPRLEIKGLAWASVFCRYAMLVAAVAYTGWRLKPGTVRLPRVEWAAQRQILRLGFPAAGHSALEMGVFSIATFVAGAVGAVPMAAHHVTLMMATFTFMFPLGISAAAAVRVGTCFGAGQHDRARLAGWLCIGLGAGVMATFALGYLLIPRPLLGIFSKDPAVVEIGVRILAVVALFQIADGIQVSATGALRGLGNTRGPMVANLIGHYPIGLVLGLVLCFPGGYGVVGLWIGLAAGLMSVAAMVLSLWQRNARRIHQMKPVALTLPVV